MPRPMTGETLSHALGFMPAYSSRLLCGLSAAMFAWRGEAMDCCYETGDELIISVHTGGARNVPFSVDGRMNSHPSRPGLVTVVPPGASAIWQTEGGIHSYSIHIKQDFLTDFLEMEITDAFRGHYAVHDAILTNSVIDLARDLASPFEVGTMMSDSLLCSIINRIVENIAQNRDRTTLMPLSRRQSRMAIELIEENLEDGISLEELAKVVGLSRAHFARSFRSTFGLPPHTYMLQRRVALARAMLADSNFAIADIALLCGFSSQSHFGDRFKAITGETPSQFRHLSD